MSLPGVSLALDTHQFWAPERRPKGRWSRRTLGFTSAVKAHVDLEVIYAFPY